MGDDMKRYYMFLITIAISLVLLVCSIEQNSYNKNYYIGKYKENNITDVTGKRLQELDDITDKLISYLKTGEDDLLSQYFNEKEILHMEDVYNLFKIARIIKYTGILIILSGTYYFYRKGNIVSLIRTIFKGLFANYILLGIVGILAYSDFSRYFTYFHLIFFTNDLWLLDPNTDLMIQMLPENFFSGIAVNIVISFLVYLAILQIVSYLYIRRDRVKYEGFIKKN